MHGDVSPKNILVGPDGPLFIDSECAWYGEPAFDLAFCLNHLLLKGARDGADKTRYEPAFSALTRVYLAGVDWEGADDLEARGAMFEASSLAGRCLQNASMGVHHGLA